MVSQNFKGKSVGRRSTPNTINGTVPPRRPVNADRRPSKYLTPKEIELLRKAARECGRYGHRDATMILIAYRHGLRPVEVCTLRWDQVDLAHELLHVRPVKNGMPSVHPIGIVRGAAIVGHWSGGVGAQR
jgi:integrase